MAAPATTVRQRVREIFEAEFAAEGFTLEDDRLLRAAGKDGKAEAAVYPEREVEVPGRVYELSVPVVVQLHLAYDAEPDEHIKVDPTVIEEYADRLRRAFKTQSSGTTADMWFLRLTGVEYPPDPTGNISRFEARIEGRAQNPAGSPQ